MFEGKTKAFSFARGIAEGFGETAIDFNAVHVVCYLIVSMNFGLYMLETWSATLFFAEEILFMARTLCILSCALCLVRLVCLH
jgi:hypothetical protein